MQPLPRHRPPRTPGAKSTPASSRRRRAAVPPFPLDLLPQPWRDWTSDTASSTAAPADYVAQAVLAALAGLCGAGIMVHILAGLVRALGAVAGGARRAVRRQVVCPRADAPAARHRRGRTPRARRRAPGASCWSGPGRPAPATLSCPRLSFSPMPPSNPSPRSSPAIRAASISWRDGPAASFADDGKGRARWLQAWNAGRRHHRAPTRRDAVAPGEPARDQRAGHDPARPAAGGAAGQRRCPGGALSLCLARRPALPRAGRSPAGAGRRGAGDAAASLAPGAHPGQ